MEVGIVDVDPLIRITRTFRLRWRIPVATGFLFASCMLRLVFSSLDPNNFSWMDAWREVRLLVSLLLVLSIIAFFRTDAFARLYFAVAAGVLGTMTPLIVIAMYPRGPYGDAVRSGMTREGALILFLTLLFVVWTSSIYPSYLLLRSVIPLGRGRVYALQLSHCRAAAEARKKARRGEKRCLTTRRRRGATAALAVLLLAGIPAWITGTWFYSLAAMTVMNDDLCEAIAQRDFARASHIVRHYEPVDRSSALSWAQIPGAAVRGSIVFVFVAAPGYLLMLGAAYSWHRWRRLNTELHRAAEDEVIPDEAVLLLRHSRDDVMHVPTRNWTLTRAPFMAFAWNFTFEELLAARLTFVGPLHALASESDRRSESMPPLGATRSIVADEDWERTVATALPRVRMAVVLLGASKDGNLASEPLRAELKMIRAGGHANKTLFLMPPMRLSWRMRARWQEFMQQFLPDAREVRKVRRLAKRVLAVCFHNDAPVIFTGAARTELSYAVVLDVAGSFVGGTDPHNRGIVTKRLRIA
jgi:hypothetical protein